MLRVNDRKQFVSGFLFLLIGLLALVKLPSHVGTLLVMGPGYFPMMLGVCLIGLGLSSMVLGIISSQQVTIARFPLVPVLFVIGGVLIFSALIDKAGLAVSLAFLIVASCYDRLRQHPFEVLLIYFAMLLLTWLIFIYAIQLPIHVWWWQ